MTGPNLVVATLIGRVRALGSSGLGTMAYVTEQASGLAPGHSHVTSCLISRTTVTAMELWSPADVW